MEYVIRVARPTHVMLQEFILRFPFANQKHTIMFKKITLRIARPRNALWRAILRRAILSMSFIRIARPIYFGFFCVDMPFK